MGFLSFAGRLLFASVFLFSSWQQFTELGVDGGPSAAAFRTKLDLITNHVTALPSLQLHNFNIKRIVAASIALKGVGGLLFVSGSSIGAYLLLLHLIISTPFCYDFYHYSMDSAAFHQILAKFIEDVALSGALLFFLGMKNPVIMKQHKANKRKSSKSKRH